MKIIFTILLILSSTEIFAKKNPLLICLAKEEEKYHKTKNQGPNYRLNQDFINEISSNDDIFVKNEYLHSICENKTFPPSVNLLHQLLLKENDLYDLTFLHVDPALRSYKMGHVNEFHKQLPRIFMQYLSSIEGEFHNTKCFRGYFPDIKYFTEKLKYLEDEVSAHKIISDKKRIENIFNKLKNIESLKRNCNK